MKLFFKKLFDTIKTNEKNAILVLVAITFIFRIIIALISFSEDDINSWADSGVYLWFGQQFANGDFNPDWGVKNQGLESAPIIPSLIAIFILLFDSPYWPFFFYNCLVTSIVVYVLYLLGKNIFNKYTGYLIAIWAMLYPDFFRYNIQLLKEPTVYLFFPLTVLLIILSIKYRERIIYVIMSSLSFSVLIHTDERYLFFAPLFLIPFIIIKNISIIKRIKSSLLWLIFCLIFALPMIMRNYKVYDEIVLISPQTITITNKFWKSKIEHYSLSFADQLIARQMYEHKTVDLTSYKEEHYKLRLNEAIKDKDSNLPYKYGYYEKYLMAFIHYWQPVYFSSNYIFDGFRYQKWSIRHNISSLLFYGIFLPFYFLGIAMVLRKKNNFGIFIAAIPIIHCAMHVYITLSLERYRSPINFCIVLIAIGYLISLLEKYHLINHNNIVQNNKWSLQKIYQRK